MKELFSRVWNSPTIMTWGSFLTRSLSLVVVLPLLLTRLQPAEITLWYLFMAIIGLQSVADVGFTPTFSRIISYVMGGAGIHDLKSPSGSEQKTLDTHTLNHVYSTMRTVYFRLGFIWTLLLATAGTLALKKPIAAVHDTDTAWLAWGVIVVVSCISFQGQQYSSYLQGTNNIALIRRWETLTTLGGIVTSFVVLMNGGGLLALVVANQGWQFINIILSRFLALSAENGMIRSFVKVPFNKEVFNAVWPSAWRSGVGVFMSYGLIQASGIIYAQIGDTASVASYLLGLRFIQIVSQFSQAPFYSKIPMLARLYAENRREELLQVAKRGMALSYRVYAACFIGLGLIGTPLFRHIESNAPFPDQILWSLLGIGFFIERYGAMHIQLYSTTNRIIWHIANGVMGLSFIIISLALLNIIGVYAFPTAILTSYLGFYGWFAALHSYRAFKMKFLSFEIGTSVMPFAAIVIYIGFSKIVYQMFNLSF
jgi:O-antigen/teichoic acid export membrane protein